MRPPHTTPAKTRSQRPIRGQRPKGNRRPQAGFTLFEILVALAIIAGMIALAAPVAFTVIDSSTIEGAARHLGAFGRAAMDKSALRHERLIARFDLKTGEYWLFYLEPPEEQKTGLFKKQGLFDQDEDGENSEVDLFAFNPQDAAEPDEAEIEKRAEKVRERMNRFTRTRLEMRANNVKHEGILSEIGPLFEKEFSLDPNAEKEKEIFDNLVGRTRLPEGVSIESIRIGKDKTYTSGQVDIEIFPLGLTAPVTFYLKGPHSRYYTVVWDHITGGAHVTEGKDTAA